MKSDKKIDVLNLEWSSLPSRDRQTATLVCNYLRYMGYSVVEDSIFNGYHLLNKYKPKIFFITNFSGADINFEITKYASLKDILSVTLISEGNFKDGKEMVDQFLWGWNTDKILYENIHMQWSERTRNLSLRYYPKLKDKIKISGGIGFDLYKISQNQNKSDFLKKYNKSNYKKVIGLACWSFGYFYEDEPHYPDVKRLFPEDVIERFKNDGEKVNIILKNIILQNKDILFLLKEHPGSLFGKISLEIQGTEKFPNVLILKNEEPIIDCINVSDFWIVYESTTAMEAWLLGKQTCLLNPSGTDFNFRDEVFRGSPNFGSIKELQNAINMFYEYGTLPNFNELEKNRSKIIKDVLQWDDGLNHIRAGNEIINLLKKSTIKKIKKDTVKQFIGKCWQMFKWYFSPCLRFIPTVNRYYLVQRKCFDKRKLNKFQEKRMKEQLEFYKKNGLTKSDLRKIRCI
jgi:surface carbohydrate biosynthesis protein